jgi:hypothetical protein
MTYVEQKCLENNLRLTDIHNHGEVKMKTFEDYSSITIYTRIHTMCSYDV